MKSSAYKAWLQSEVVNDEALKKEYTHYLQQVCVFEQSTVLDVAMKELFKSVLSLLDLVPNIISVANVKACTMIGTVQSTDWTLYGMDLDQLNQVGREGYLIKASNQNDQDLLVIIGGSTSGVLYGVFHLLRLIRMGRQFIDLHILENPTNRLRMINHWDNADGSVERGYAGNSIFFHEGAIIQQLDRIRDYAIMLASIGINAITINNVNVHEIETHYITEPYLPDVARIADVFRDYGIQLFLSINYASPMQIGQLTTADPLDDQVREWWKEITKTIYTYIPDFGGFLVKADSEHRPGPFTYGRDHADGANMLADALHPHNGLVIWRCFVYNCMQDWRDRTTDRARAAYDHFKPLDGAFHDNVILQVKNGPMDFQVREPVSPLFGAMPNTNQLLEFQIAQEYTGQQKHLCYLVPQWKEVIDFDTFARGEGSTVGLIVSGQLFNSRIGGYAAVSNLGDDNNWTGHTLAQANLYGYGRLIWNPQLSAEVITDEWIRLTFNNDDRVVAVIRDMLMNSRTIYENYTAPLGVGWMITPNHHYGPDVDGYEYSRWGTYHFADRNGIGVDRTIATGTRYVEQYALPNATIYESLEQCPDELLLFFHHVNYSHRLQSGKSVIQHIYDTHFEGVEQTQWLVQQWSSLEAFVEQDTYVHVLGRLQEQAIHAELWRDVINTYFYRKSGIPDELGRTIY